MTNIESFAVVTPFNLSAAINKKYKNHSSIIAIEKYMTGPEEKPFNFSTATNDKVLRNIQKLNTKKASQQTFFLVVTHFIIAYHICIVNVLTNYYNNNLLILDVKQLNRIMKLYYFYTLKAL